MVARAYAMPVEPRVEGRTRDEMCRHYQPRLVGMANKVGGRVPDAGLEVEDLVGLGVVGLLEAFDRYNPLCGVEFSVYAEYRIRGAMLDALRAEDTSTRRARQAGRRIDDAVRHRRASLGRPPTHAEIAVELGMDMETYWRNAEMARGAVRAPVREARNQTDDTVSPLTRLLAQEARMQLRAAIERLPDRERQITTLYYGRGMSLAEVGRVFGVSMARICQILSAVCGKLRVSLQDTLDAEALSNEP